MAIDPTSAAAAYLKANKGLDNKLALAQPEGIQSQFNPSFPQLVETAANKAIDTNYIGEGFSMASLSNKSELHELIGAVTNVDLTVQLVVAVRDRVINAYNDIIKMPI